MSLASRLRDLDRRAEAWGTRYAREYDAEPPWWIKYGGFAAIILGPASLPLTMATSPAATVALLLSLSALYVLAAATWTARHRGEVGAATCPAAQRLRVAAMALRVNHAEVVASRKATADAVPGTPRRPAAAG